MHHVNIIDKKYWVYKEDNEYKPPFISSNSIQHQTTPLA